MNILVAGLVLVSPAPRIRRYLGVLFIFSTTIYILISANEVIEILGPLMPYLKIFAVLNSVFFWWFALSLFEDDFVWDVPKVGALLAVLVLHFSYPLWASEAGPAIKSSTHASISAVLFGHAIWIALRDRSNDLVDPRRRFRLFFAVTISLVGMVIVVVEGSNVVRDAPLVLTLLHACALAILTLAFAYWMLSADAGLFASESSSRSHLQQGFRLGACFAAARFYCGA